MSPRVAPFGPARLSGWLTLVAVLLAAASVLAVPTAATAAEDGAPVVEEEGHSPSIDEIGTQNEVSGQYLPEEAEPPPFMRFFYVPLIIGGLLIVGALLVLYLAWQPRFAEERRSKRRR